MNILRTMALALWVPLGAAAHGPGVPAIPDGDVAVGPSVAWLAGDGVAVDLDLSLTVLIFAASVAPLYVNTDAGEGFGVRGELTAWFFANVGGGVGYLDGPWQTMTAHAFIGVPLGETLSALVGADWGPFKVGFVEPYYRATFLLDQEAVFHELGVYLKVTTFE